MPGERHVEQPPVLVFQCRFVPSRSGSERTVRLVEAEDADQALHQFAMLLSSSKADGWIDVLDPTGALVRTQFHSPAE